MTSEIDWKMLRHKATEAAAHAYAPYSHFPVGAAALVDDGRVVSGCNVENASYGVGCAPSAAWSARCTRAAAAGWSRCPVWTATGRLLMPCGRCRQLLWSTAARSC